MLILQLQTAPPELLLETGTIRQSGWPEGRSAQGPLRNLAGRGERGAASMR